MTKVPKTGDKVKWNTTQGETHGTVERIATATTKIKGHVAKATKDAPQAVVKSDKSGSKAVHKLETLKKN